MDTNTKNAETSKQEIAEFIANPPARYMAYVKGLETIGNSFMRGVPCRAMPCKVITFVGDTLGEGRLGTPYLDNFGGVRQSIRFTGVNGKTYSGTYYASAGDYCRVKMCK